MKKMNRLNSKMKVKKPSRFGRGVSVHFDVWGITKEGGRTVFANWPTSLSLYISLPQLVDTIPIG